MERGQGGWARGARPREWACGAGVWTARTAFLRRWIWWGRRTGKLGERLEQDELVLFIPDGLVGAPERARARLACRATRAGGLGQGGTRVGGRGACIASHTCSAVLLSMRITQYVSWQSAGSCRASTTRTTMLWSRRRLLAAILVSGCVRAHGKSSSTVTRHGRAARRAGGARACLRLCWTGPSAGAARGRGGVAMGGGRAGGRRRSRLAALAYRRHGASRATATHFFGNAVCLLMSWRPLVLVAVPVARP